MDYTKFVEPLRKGIVDSIEVEYSDEDIIDLWVFLKYNRDICFDGLTLSLCINK